MWNGGFIAGRWSSGRHFKVIRDWFPVPTLPINKKILSTIGDIFFITLYTLSVVWINYLFSLLFPFRSLLAITEMMFSAEITATWPEARRNRWTNRHSDSHLRRSSEPIPEELIVLQPTHFSVFLITKLIPASSIFIELLTYSWVWRNWKIFGQLMISTMIASITYVFQNHFPMFHLSRKINQQNVRIWRNENPCVIVEWESPKMDVFLRRVHFFAEQTNPLRQDLAV